MADNSVRYMDRSRIYYEAHGYEKSYRWAHHDSVPFARLAKPLKDCTVTLVTTAMPDASFSGDADVLHMGDMNHPPESFYTEERFWDKEATHTDDVDSFFPLRELARRVSEGSIGGLSDHYYCVPTEYSQRRTIENDAPAIVQSCIDEGADVALLLPL
ncbi:MAG: hypothetical protein V3S89_01050 [Desulfobacterales bacterium]